LHRDTWRRHPAMTAALLCLAVSIFVVLALVLLHGDDRAHSTTASSATHAAPEPDLAEVVRGDFTSVMVLEGIVQPTPPTPLLAASAGTEVHWTARDGDLVAEGAVLYEEAGADGGVPAAQLREQLRTAESALGFARRRSDLDVAEAKSRYEQATLVSDAPEGKATVADAGLQLARAKLAAEEAVAQAEEAARQARARLERAEGAARVVRAPHAGVLRIGASVVADAGTQDPALVGVLDSQAFEVAAPVEPLLLYRLPEQLPEARVEIRGGPGPFPCRSPELVQSAPAELASSGSDELATATPAAVTQYRCEVPPDIRVFAGLEALVSVSVAELHDALTVPASAMGDYTGSAGTVTVVGTAGVEEKRTVALGLSDGLVVVVTEGLREGERVRPRLEIPPAALGGG
jgi:multidrug efflux pump subunit AcrA (membrane-fusion protein)